MNLSADEILSIPHIAANDFDRMSTVVGVSTDSRTVERGQAFVAIRGERLDGHDFLSTAIQRSAAAIVVEARWVLQNATMMASIHVPRLVVDNTVQALGALARLHRRRFSIPVIAVGGSNGKTTTKEMIRTVLEQRYRVLATQGNLNNHIGVPHTLFKLDKDHEAAVIEMGTNHAGEIAYLCSVAEPTHGLITNIGREHLEHFGSVSGVAHAEGELFAWIGGRKGTAFVNADDARIVSMTRRLKQKVTFGFRSRFAHVRGSRPTLDEQGRSRFQARKAAGRSFDIEVPIPGVHNAANALAAAAIGLTLKVPSGSVAKALARFQAASKRMQTMQIMGATVLNDAYNANPDSMLAALATLGAIQTQGKRIAVLADMLELGTSAEKAHRAIGRALKKNGIDHVLAYGPLARHVVDAATSRVALHYDNKNVLAEHLKKLIAPGDVVLVKGSRGMQMEDIVTSLMDVHQTMA